MLTTVDEVLAALGDLGAVTDRHRERHERFRARFCFREDGHATERVLALVLPGQTSPESAA